MPRKTTLATPKTLEEAAALPVTRMGQDGTIQVRVGVEDRQFRLGIIEAEDGELRLVAIQPS